MCWLRKFDFLLKALLYSAISSATCLAMLKNVVWQVADKPSYNNSNNNNNNNNNDNDNDNSNNNNNNK